MEVTRDFGLTSLTLAAWAQKGIRFCHQGTTGVAYRVDLWDPDLNGKAMSRREIMS